MQKNHSVSGAVAPDAGQPFKMSSRAKRPYVRRAYSVAPERALTLDRKRVAYLVRHEEDGDLPPVECYDRPMTRGDCEDAERPCPYVSCKHHLYLDSNPETGSIKLNFPDKEPWELKDSCALDVAQQGGITLEEVGAIVNLTRERVRQIEVRAVIKLRKFAHPDGPLAFEEHSDKTEIHSDSKLLPP